jgi:hypothetical protein
MRLIVDNGLFFEFVRPGELSQSTPNRCWLADAQTGVNYALVVSSCAGLWSYIVGDTIRFVDLHPPRVLVTGRLSYFLSAFGEHLAGEEIEAAVCKAADAVHATIAEFAVGAVFSDADDPRGGHVYVVEFGQPPHDQEQIGAFANVLDDTLCSANEDYRAHRSGGFGLRPPHILAVRPGTFAAWMKQRRQLGGQHKVPRVINDQTLFEDLRRLAVRCDCNP